MPESRHKVVCVVMFALWLIAATFAGATLTAWHAVALPSGAKIAVSRVAGAKTWHVAHYLSADCTCSLAVARHLIARRPLASVTEEVFWIAATDHRTEVREMDALNRLGFHSTSIGREIAASRYHVEGVPLLEVEAPDGSVRFRGGYRKRNVPNDEYLDTAIVSDLMNSITPPRLRVYGCATSHRLKSLLDPLSILSL